MRLSIVITIYKESINEVKRAINSIYLDTLLDCEIIIVLDNPSDNNMKEYLLQHYSNHQNFKLIFNTENIGAGESRNKAIEASIGRYIAMLDSDDEYINNKLQKQYQYIVDNPHIDILFTGWEEKDTKTLKIEKKIPKKEWFKKPNKYFFIKSMLLHSSIMVKSDVMKNYPYSNIKRGEDFKIFLDMISDDVKFDILEEPLYRYYVTKESDEIYRNKVHLFSKYFFAVLNKKVEKFLFNPFFWVMYIRIFFEYITSYSNFTYKIFYIGLKQIMKKLIT